MAASSTRRSSAAAISRRFQASRAVRRAGGLRRLPIWSARKGGLARSPIAVSYAIDGISIFISEMAPAPCFGRSDSMISDGDARGGRKALAAELEGLTGVARVASLDATRITRELKARAADVQALLGRAGGSAGAAAVEGAAERGALAVPALVRPQRVLRPGLV